MTETPSTIALLGAVLDELRALRQAIEAQRSAPPAAPEPEGVFDVAGTAAFARVSPSTIYRAAERGKPRCLRAGVRLRFARADIDVWMRGERGRQGSVVALRPRS